MVVGMSTRLVNVDRDTPLLLPADLREWVPEDDLVHFVIGAVANVEVGRFKVNTRGTGSAQYPPRMMLGLLIYCYALGTFSSRKIERATWRDLGVRYLTGDTHPDHDTISSFRQENLDLVAGAFLEVLKLAREMKLLKVGNISIDGVHIRANASKHQNLTYRRAGQIEAQLKQDIADLLEKGRLADRQEKLDPARLPEEVGRREKLLEKMRAAQENLEAKAKERAALERAEYEKKLAARQERRAQGKGGSGSEPKEPPDQPQGGEQVNLTDADSKLMKKGRGGEYNQNYNAQAAVDAEGTMLVVGVGLTDCANDSQQLEPMVKSVPPELGPVRGALADTGFANAQALERLSRERTREDGSKAPGIDLYVAIGREENRRRYEFRPPEAVKRPGKEPSDPTLVAMKEKLRTPEGRRVYAKRKETVEPVFGIIKGVMGFRQFLLRGLEKVRGEWTLVCLAYNVRRLHSLVRQVAPG
jgi:transposase